MSGLGKKRRRVSEYSSDGIRVYFAPLGNDYAKESVAIWAPKLKEKNIHVLPKFKSKNVDFVVASVNIPKEALEKHLGKKYLELPPVLRLSWALDSIKSESPLVTGYEWESAIESQVESPCDTMEWREKSRFEMSRIPTAFENICKDYNELVGFINEKEKEAARQGKMMCQKPSEQMFVHSVLNDELAKEMEWFSNYYKVVDNSGNNKFREPSYKRASDLFRNLTYQVTLENLQETKIASLGIGDGIMKKASQVLENGGPCDKRKELENHPTTKAIFELTGLHGIGCSSAHKFHKAGFSSIKSIRESLGSEDPQVVSTIKRMLSKPSLTALPYYEDLQIRIPRNEVELIGNYVREVALKLFSKNGQVIAEITGSFRRGKASSGDVDVVLTCKGYPGGSLPLLELVTELGRLGFIKADLVDMDKKIPSNGKVSDYDTYFGICKHPDFEIHRRLDIKVYPPENFAFALLHFTGSDHFNRSIRYLARKKGWRLNECGVFEAIRDGEKTTVANKSLLYCETEQEIFDFFHIPYKTPRDRNGFDKDAWNEIFHTSEVNDSHIKLLQSSDY